MYADHVPIDLSRHLLVAGFTFSFGALMMGLLGACKNSQPVSPGGFPLLCLPELRKDLQDIHKFADNHHLERLGKIRDLVAFFLPSSALPPLPNFLTVWRVKLKLLHEYHRSTPSASTAR